MKNSSFQGAVQVFDEMLRFLAVDTKGLFLKRIFDSERLYGEMFGIRFSFQHYLFELLDRKFQQMFAGGIIEFYNREYKDYLNPKRYEHLHPTGPQVLTLEHLRAGFVVWLVSVVFAILTFIWEWIVTLINYVITKYIFKSFYEFLNFEIRRKQDLKSKAEKVKKQRTQSVDELIELITFDSRPFLKKSQRKCLGKC